jgi:4-carboxymuconolactone decarboxylase
MTTARHGQRGYRRDETLDDTTQIGAVTMSHHAENLDGRLPLADPATLNGAQREMFDRMMTTVVPWAQGAGFQSTTADGRLIGPFNPCLLNPAISAQFLQLQFVEEQHTSLGERLRQVVILTVGAVWAADYELYAHSALARQAGVPEAAIATLVGGALPEDLSEHERTAHRLARQLSTSDRVDEQLYRDAAKAFGAKGVLEITVLTGIYHTVCASQRLRRFRPMTGPHPE